MPEQAHQRNFQFCFRHSAPLQQQCPGSALVDCGSEKGMSGARAGRTRLKYVKHCMPLMRLTLTCDTFSVWLCSLCVCLRVYFSFSPSATWPPRKEFRPRRQSPFESALLLCVYVLLNDSDRGQRQLRGHCYRHTVDNHEKNPFRSPPFSLTCKANSSTVRHLPEPALSI